MRSRIGGTVRFEELEPPTSTLAAEMENDVWDVRRMPGIKYSVVAGQHLLRFTEIPSPFRPLVKRFIALCITRYSVGTCKYYTQYLPKFFNFYHAKYPEAVDLRELSRRDIEEFLVHLRGLTMGNGEPANANFVFRSVGALEQFLLHLERTASPEGPTTSTAKLIWPEDRSRWPQANWQNKVKHIPDSVLVQVDRHLDDLAPTVRAAVIVLRASGWRVSDVLCLHYDTCLDKTSSGWWLCGDISKSNVEAHRVPITEEVAQAIMAQIKVAGERFDAGENPSRWLFPSNFEERKGLPISALGVRQVLQKWGKKHKITDDTGKLYSFSPHAFRHTKGVELINNGMSLHHVQKWLAHASPEMTLTYAKILDPTLREQWEKAFGQGAVRIDSAGAANIVPVEILNDEMIEWERIRHNLDAVRLPNGFCFKPKKLDCPTQAIPCHACHHFCTTPEFLPAFQKELKETDELIQLGLDAGREAWVQRNRQNREKLIPIIELLQTGKLHHPVGKAVREQIPPQEKTDGS